MKGYIRKISSLFIIVACVMIFNLPAYAAKEGWYQAASGNIYYYAAAESGTQKVTGLKKIGKNYYYFNEKGILQTGWQGIRYFTTSGVPGKMGRMVTGFKKIGTDYFYFDDENGKVFTGGFKKSGDYWYYFRSSGETGVRGAALQNKWTKAEGAMRYFGKYGRMTVNKWVGQYYVGSDGKLLYNTITPDGYLLDKKGKKVGNTTVKGWVKIDGKYYTWSARLKSIVKASWVKYGGETFYVDKNGARVSGLYHVGDGIYWFDEKTGAMFTGLLQNGSRSFYFDPRTGKMLVSGKLDGYTSNARGVVTKYPPVKILVDAGHGQGDPGAVSPLGQESEKTREFAKLLYNKLMLTANVSVTYLENGSKDYDLYQRNRATLSGISISGTGSNKNAVINKMRQSSNIPDLSVYNYVIEVHFNATVVQNKDYGGNGNYKGFMIYVNKYKSSSAKAVDKAMINAIKGTGFKIFGSGVEASSGLYNAKVCQEIGVNYSLIETAFIDDADDMKFYNKNKNKMAEVIAKAIRQNIVK